MLEPFLKELTDLSKRHGVYIGGCGCCGSPFLYDGITKGEAFLEYLELDEKGCYIADDKNAERK